MTTKATWMLALALCGCATQHPVPRVDSPPPHWQEPARATGAAVGSRPADDPTDRFLAEEIARKSGNPAAPPLAPRYAPPPDTRQSYEPETKRFLDSEIERKTPPPEPPPEEQQVRYIQRTVYVDGPYGRRYYYGYPYYGERHVHYGRYPRSTFPVNTVLGAGIGAVIGNQHRHRAARGAWIGGGIGLLLDLASGRW